MTPVMRGPNLYVTLLDLTLFQGPSPGWLMFVSVSFPFSPITLMIIWTHCKVCFHIANLYTSGEAVFGCKSWYLYGQTYSWVLFGLLGSIVVKSRCIRWVDTLESKGGNCCKAPINGRKYLEFGAVFSFIFFRNSFASSSPANVWFCLLFRSVLLSSYIIGIVFVCCCCWCLFFSSILLLLLLYLLWKHSC